MLASWAQPLALDWGYLMAIAKTEKQIRMLTIK
jgi:hypothetical protein